MLLLYSIHALRCAGGVHQQLKAQVKTSQDKSTLTLWRVRHVLSFGLRAFAITAITPAHSFSLKVRAASPWSSREAAHSVLSSKRKLPT